MTDEDRIDRARDQLGRILDFFSRVDGKASVVLGINTGMLAILATRAVPYPNLGWKWVPIALTVFFLGLSYWKLYQQSFPDLEGGNKSLIYFREIAGRIESDFIKEWNALSVDDYCKDLLAQVWRNSQILKDKFDHLKWAMRFMAFALVPWLITLAWLSWNLKTVTP